MAQIVLILLAAGLIYLTGSAMIRMFRGALHPHGHHPHPDPPDPPGQDKEGS